MRRGSKTGGFTLAETLLTGSILAVMMGVLLVMTEQTSRLFHGTAAKIEQFQDSRVAFEAMSRRLAGATLNSFLDFQYEISSQGGNGSASRTPTGYTRSSELRFRSGPMAGFSNGQENPAYFRPTHGVFFQAPSGIVADTARLGSASDLLNSWGYFIEAGSDAEFMPPCVRGRVPPRRRFRLMEFMEPSESLSVYQFQRPRSTDWFMRAVDSRKERHVRALAEDVVALVLLPKLAKADEDAQLRARRGTTLAPGFHYDSTQSHPDPVLNPKHQLPPIVEVVMVALDGKSADRLAREFKDDPAMGLDFDGYFENPERLNSDRSPTAEGLAGDIARFEEQLAKKLKLNYRVFVTNVAIRGAKWSRTQEN
jgi:uncharacterized protein (TIGR02599 family)